MKRCFVLLALGAVTLLWGSPEPSSGEAERDGPQGRLVIVGGALRASNEAVFAALLERAGDGRVGIVPAASSHPLRSARKFREQLIAHGVASDRIEILELANRDDAETPEIDERTWNAHAEDAALAARVAGLSVIWFTGGDQARIRAVLGTPQKGASPVLAAIHEVYRRGGTIGGTSAGAAIQSDPMILGGTSPEALLQGLTEDYAGMAAQESGPLVLGPGMGWFPHGLIDQHFDRKGRLGRLLVALGEVPAAGGVGYGIDEDTALIFDAAHGTATVVGSGSVTLLDIRPAQRSPVGWTGVRLSLLTAGDRLRWPGPAVTIDPRKQATVGQEYMDLPAPSALGPLAPYTGRLEDLLGYLLLDNRSATTLDARVQAPEGTGFRFRFTQTPESRGYWAALDGEFIRYSALDVSLSVEALP